MQRLFRNRVFLSLDLVAWAVFPVLALALRLDTFVGLGDYRVSLLFFVGVGIVCKFLSLWNFGLYRRFWAYASIDELMLIPVAVVSGSLAATALQFVFEQAFLTIGPRLPHSVPIIDAMLTVLWVGGTRFALRVSLQLKRRWRGRSVGTPVLIVGAGEAGALIAKELLGNPALKLDPVAFIDDDPAKRNSTIHGLPVFGPRSILGEVAGERHVREVIIAMPAAPGRVIRDLLDVCEEAGLLTKIVPGVTDILSGRVHVTKIRDVQIEDLLRREPVATDPAAVAELVEGMTVLVTGAGGSIGSELCRQIARFNARQIILLGHGENSIFEIHNELLAAFPQIELIPTIADVRNGLRIQQILERHRPQAVFHTAAHKHVPMMEANPLEAVTNNVGGTMHVLEAAERTGVSHFVLISTDKAVRPANVMGATKLIAEQLVHAAAERMAGVYVSVRFGNVLGSRGSVVPLFQKQIAQGGPVTVTHPEIARYFMTIPEAVQLVLQASALGKGGETFVLDMGEQVRIVQLARDLIHLSGLEEGRDIEIRFTGLRPGEKMFEELFIDGENFERTSHHQIFVARNGDRSTALTTQVSELVAAASDGDTDRTLSLLSTMVAGVSGGRVAESLVPSARRILALKPK